MNDLPDYVEPEYRMVDGKYVFFLNGEAVFRSNEVAILFDERCNTVLKHGSPEVVAAAHTRMRTQYLAAGLLTNAADLVVVQGKLDVEGLNAVIHLSDHIKVFYKRLKESGAVS